MIVYVNTRLTPDDLNFVITPDARQVFLLGPLKGHGKIHWARRGETIATTTCGTRVDKSTTWTGKISDITCSKCSDKWWANERILGTGGAGFIQGYL